MKFQLTEEQNYIRKATQDFAKGEFDEYRILELMENRSFPENIFKNACKLDLIGLTYPESAGGQECNMMDNILVIEELCRKDSGIGIALSLPDMGAELIARYGNADMIKKYISPLLKGKTLPAVINPFPGQMTGDILFEKTEDGIILAGEAPLVLNAGIAGYFVVVASPQNPGTNETGDNIIAVVDKDTQGMEIKKNRRKLGLDMLSWHPVTFNDVKIPAKNILTPPAKPVNLEMELQKSWLMKLSAMYLGIAQGAYDLALDYAKQREQFRKKIAGFQGISEKIARMYMELEKTRAMVYTTAALYDEKTINLHELTATKLCAESAAEYITDESLQIHGGVGYMIEFPIEHFFRDVKLLRTLMGRKTFQMDIISHKLIGKLK